MLFPGFLHFLKNVPIRSVSGPNFPTCQTIRTKKTPNTNTCHLVLVDPFFTLLILYTLSFHIFIVYKFFSNVNPLLRNVAKWSDTL